MTLRIFTGRIGFVRVKDDPDAIDVTRGSGGVRGAPFAPSTELFRWMLRQRQLGKKEESWPVFRAKYLAEMEDSYQKNKAAWEGLFLFERVVALCYCENALRCHRLILARELLVPLGGIYEGEIGDER